MSTLSKALASIAALSAVAVFSFLTGELIGMKSGYAHTLKMTAPMDAAYTVSVINLIDNNMNGEAKEMLETRLDNYIISHWSARKCRLIGLNPFIQERPIKEMFYSTISYRKSHPSDNEIIQNHLDYIAREM